MNAEARMENFRKRNSFFEISREGTIIQNKFENLENEKTAFELQLQYYNYLSEYLNSKNIDATIISPTVMGITDPILLKLVNDLSEIRTEREKLSFNIEINQPAIQLIEKQNEETRKALMENVTNGIERLNLSIRQTNRKIAAVDTLINMLPTTEKEFINIQRKFDLNNTVYTYLLEKRAESGIAKASNLPDNRIIDYASSSGQVKPKTRKNYMVALIIGLVIPMIVIGIIDYLNDKVIDRKDVEKKTRVPIIGYVSHNEGKTEIPVYEKPSSSIAESFRSIRTALKYFVKGKDVAVIAISSTISSEGKTFISINLASIIAMLGKKVLLVGLDLRKPRINKIFECDNSPGMSSFLIGDCEYKEIIKNTQVNNLFYVPSGLTPPNPAELIETEYMKDFIMKAREEFDYIIIDTPPVAIVTDALLIAEHVDINLFIVRQRYSSISTLELIQQLKNQDELKNIAIVINDISLSGYYGYGMRYGYASGYGYSYGGTYYGRGYYDRYGEKNNARGYYIED
jgi:capsular exopolysaccharide synthesis family protein